MLDQPTSQRAQGAWRAVEVGNQQAIPARGRTLASQAQRRRVVEAYHRGVVGQRASVVPQELEQFHRPLGGATFGRLEPVRIRDHWRDEAREFTQWLAKEENLELLGETIGASLELVGTERRVGPFKADLVATDGEVDVVVENQLEATDHKHLGQLLVYAAGRRAGTVVWVAKQVTDEYRKVIDWLNEETGTNFWALEIDLWRIGDSPVAPKFNIVCEPNELTKEPSPGESAELSESKLLQLEFWKGLVEFFEANGSVFNPRKPSPQHWFDLPIGTSRAHIALTALVARSGRIGCELYINHSQADLIFAAVENDRAAVEAQLGELEWQPLPDRKGCRIAVYRDAGIENRDSWPELFGWMKEQAERFRVTFADRVKAVDVSPPPVEPGAADRLGLSVPDSPASDRADPAA